MAKFEDLQQQLMTEFLRLCDVIDRCARILLQQSPEPVLPGIGGPAEQQTEEYVKKVSIDAAKKKDAVWDVYTLMGQLHGHVSPIDDSHLNGVDAALGKLEQAAYGADGVLDRMDDAKDRLGDWEGKAAVAVLDKLSELKTFARNQNAAVKLLQEVLTQYNLLVRTGEDNAEQFSAALTDALTDAAALAETTKREFKVKMFDGALAAYEAKKDPIALFQVVRQVVGDIQERNEVLAATQPDKIIAESTPKVAELRENLAAAGDRLAKSLEGVVTDITTENGRTFFSGAKATIDIRDPHFTSAEFRLREADGWGKFAEKVDKLPKTLPEDEEPGPLTRRLEGTPA
ncbi:hypothetical protein M8542_31410 [Amycolatopsis sp. OK19-0408]|uniref:Uncharacterized protein n=1 Tax=Amycolatopsis iheyensis TaxID=2945988 RepID=A0A9X2NGE6_9PSEU|nr:hypothetical protein [Amycolatopsis iheyensis]MCR6487347.1 hypothetical protein [Amycolatopsis iheyensis]